MVEPPRLCCRFDFLVLRELVSLVKRDHQSFGVQRAQVLRSAEWAPYQGGTKHDGCSGDFARLHLGFQPAHIPLQLINGADPVGRERVACGGGLRVSKTTRCMVECGDSRYRHGAAPADASSSNPCSLLKSLRSL